MNGSEFALLILFGPIAFLLIWIAGAWLNNQSLAEWFKTEILKKRR